LNRLYDNRGRYRDSFEGEGSSVMGREGEGGGVINFMFSCLLLKWLFW
jgi:hypothetical protein